MQIQGSISLLVAVLVVVPVPGVLAASPRGGDSAASVEVYATGLDNPRGLKFGPDGALYVAEAGIGGTRSTVGLCPQVPVGPMRGGLTGRVSRIDASGARTTVVAGLPSSVTAPAYGSSILGTQDVEFLHGKLFVLLTGGCPKANPGIPNSIVEVNAPGTFTQLTDLSAFWANNPPGGALPPDYDIEGVPYVLARRDGQLFVLEANHGEIDKVRQNGKVSRLLSFNETVGHVVPTAMTVGPDGDFYVGTFSLVPYLEGTASLYKVTPSGKLTSLGTGFSTVLGLAFDDEGRLYVLESSTGGTGQPPYLFPGTGRIRRLTSSGFELVVSGLDFPAGMTFGPDGALYVSNVGYGVGTTPGMGQILRIEVGP